MRDRSADRLLIFWVAVFAVVLFGIAGYLVFADRTVYKNYYSDKFELSMKYPEGWTLAEIGYPGIVVAVATPLRDSLDTFQDNVSVTVTDLRRKPGITMDQFTKITLEQTMGMFKDGIRVETTQPDRMGGHPAYKFVWGMRAPIGMESMQGSTIKYFHVWAFYKNFAYMFTYAAQEDQFRTYLPQAKVMLRSVRFGKQNP